MKAEARRDTTSPMPSDSSLLSLGRRCLIILVYRMAKKASAHTDPPVGGRSDSMKLWAPADVRQAECQAAHGINQDCAHRIATECPRLKPIRDNQRVQNFTTSAFPAHAPQTLPAYPIPRSPHWRR